MSDLSLSQNLPVRRRAWSFPLRLLLVVLMAILGSLLEINRWHRPLRRCIVLECRDITDVLATIS
jgi:hypothetical protein